jgi:hypothetical protein
LLGVKVSGDSRYEKFESYIDHGHEKEITRKNGLTAIYDGMNGKYILVGRVLERSSMDQPLDGPIEMKVPDWTTVELLRGLLATEFGIENADVQLWFVTHYH